MRQGKDGAWQDKEKGPNHHSLPALADAEQADIICVQEHKLQVQPCLLSPESDHLTAVPCTWMC